MRFKQRSSSIETLFAVFSTFEVDRRCKIKGEEGRNRDKKANENREEAPTRRMKANISSNHGYWSLPPLPPPTSFASWKRLKQKCHSFLQGNCRRGRIYHTKVIDETLLPYFQTPKEEISTQTYETYEFSNVQSERASRRSFHNSTIQLAILFKTLLRAAT